MGRKHRLRIGEQEHLATKQRQEEIQGKVVEPTVAHEAVGAAQAVAALHPGEGFREATLRQHDALGIPRRARGEEDDGKCIGVWRGYVRGCAGSKIGKTPAAFHRPNDLDRRQGGRRDRADKPGADLGSRQQQPRPDRRENPLEALPRPLMRQRHKGGTRRHHGIDRLNSLQTLRQAERDPVARSDPRFPLKPAGDAQGSVGESRVAQAAGLGREHPLRQPIGRQAQKPLQEGKIVHGRSLPGTGAAESCVPTIPQGEGLRYHSGKASQGKRCQIGGDNLWMRE